ncbi:MAG: tetratricopeptide repeat protein, partial [Burkholderiaceae bacterium]
MSSLHASRNRPCACGSGKKAKRCCLAEGQSAGSPPAAERTLTEAIAHHRAGRLAQADALYRDVLAALPDHPDALHLSGTVAYQTGQLDLAAERIGRAIALRPTAAMHGNLGLVRQAQGRTDDAFAAFREALRLDPADAGAHGNLGNLLQATGRPAEAVECHLQALALAPDCAPAYCNLGAALHDLGHWNEAVECDDKAIALDPGYAMAWNNRGNALRALGRTDAARASLERSLALDPHYPMGWNNLGNLLRDQGDPEAAIAHYRRALDLDPSLAEVFSNLLLTMHTVARFGPDALFAEHLRFAQCYEAPLMASWQPHPNVRDKARRLRLGYVSGDFREHAVVNFLEPILAAHDKAQVEVFCYHNHPQEDAATRRIRALADRWVPCHGMPDAALSARIRADTIDILVDLSGHTAHNRLLTFVRKPAPVQLSWIGYQFSTGLSAMDYRLTDAALDPVGMTERFHTETLLRMPAAAPFTPAADSPPVNLLPALTAGCFTFACLNQLTKISERMIALWAEILAALPHARLMLGNANDDTTRDRLLAAFAWHGVAPARIAIQPRLPLRDYLALHHAIDLGLDSFPYNGGTTTCHA